MNTIVDEREEKSSRPQTASELELEPGTLFYRFTSSTSGSTVLSIVTDEESCVDLDDGSEYDFRTCENVTYVHSVVDSEKVKLVLRSKN